MEVVNKASFTRNNLVVSLDQFMTISPNALIKHLNHVRGNNTCQLSAPQIILLVLVYSATSRRVTSDALHTNGRGGSTGAISQPRKNRKHFISGPFQKVPFPL